MDPRLWFSEMMVKLLSELGEALTHIIEAVWVRGQERVFDAVKLEKDIKYQLALRRGEGIAVRIELHRKVIKKVMHRGVEEASMVDTLVEKEA